MADSFKVRLDFSYFFCERILSNTQTSWLVFHVSREEYQLLAVEKSDTTDLTSSVNFVLDDLLFLSFKSVLRFWGDHYLVDAVLLALLSTACDIYLLLIERNPYRVNWLILELGDLCFVLAVFETPVKDKSIRTTSVET